MIEVEERAQRALAELGQPGEETPAPIVNAIAELEKIRDLARAEIERRERRLESAGEPAPMGPRAKAAAKRKRKATA